MSRNPFPNPLCIAMDFDNKEKVLEISENIKGVAGGIKIGLQLFIKEGNELLKILYDKGHRIFLDLKLHGIPNTVRNSIKIISEMPVEMTTVHAMGGPSMLEEAVKTRDKYRKDLKILAVTILTSMDENCLNMIGMKENIENHVLNLAKIALDCGVDGLVCSPEEVILLRQEFGPSPLLVVPGIRPKQKHMKNDDQKRVSTPENAIKNGSDILVIGRPVTLSENPEKEIEKILKKYKKINLKNPRPKKIEIKINNSKKHADKK